MALNWGICRIPLNKVAGNSVVSATAASTTYYGFEASKKVRVLAAKFYSDGAITGSTVAKYDVGIFAGGTRIANLALNTGTDHVANDYTNLTMDTANVTDTTAIVSANTTLTCGCVKTGSPGNLSTNSWVDVVVVPVEIF